MHTGARTVVHPSARILAEGGPIVIGESNLIQEKALIRNRSVEITCDQVNAKWPCIWDTIVNFVFLHVGRRKGRKKGRR